MVGVLGINPKLRYSQKKDSQELAYSHIHCSERLRFIIVEEYKIKSTKRKGICNQVEETRCEGQRVTPSGVTQDPLNSFNSELRQHPKKLTKDLVSRVCTEGQSCSYPLSNT